MLRRRRYNRLLAVIYKSLRDLLKALKGLVVMSQQLEEMANSIYVNQVPTLWTDKVPLVVFTGRYALVFGTDVIIHKVSHVGRPLNETIGVALRCDLLTLNPRKLFFHIFSRSLSTSAAHHTRYNGDVLVVVVVAVVAVVVVVVVLVVVAAAVAVAVVVERTD